MHQVPRARVRGCFSEGGWARSIVDVRQQRTDRDCHARPPRAKCERQRGDVGRSYEVARRLPKNDESNGGLRQVCVHGKNVEVGRLVLWQIYFLF